MSVEVLGKWGKVCWDEGRCGEVWYKVWLEPTHSSTHTLHNHSTPFPTLIQHLSPHSPETSLTTLPHSSHTSTHFPTSPHPLHLSLYFPSPSLTPLPHTHSRTSPQAPHLLQHFPILYHLPHTKIFHVSYLLPN